MTVCAVSDVVLIAVGVAGLGQIVDAVPWFVEAARWGGAAFLACYAVLSLRRAVLGTSGSLEEPDAADAPTTTGTSGGTAVAERVRSGRTGAVLTALALTWLNPHVYLDTVVLLGSVAASHGGSRAGFAAGAMVASIVWFTGLGAGARHLGRWLRDPPSWRAIDGVVGALMLVLAVTLVAGG